MEPPLTNSALLSSLKLYHKEATFLPPSLDNLFLLPTPAQASTPASVFPLPSPTRTMLPTAAGNNNITFCLYVPSGSISICTGTTRGQAETVTVTVCLGLLCHTIGVGGGQSVICYWGSRAVVLVGCRWLNQTVEGCYVLRPGVYVNSHQQNAANTIPHCWKGGKGPMQGMHE